VSYSVSVDAPARFPIGAPARYPIGVLSRFPARRAALAAACALLCACAASRPLPPQERLATHEAQRLVPLLLEVLRFHTVQGDAAARAAQQEWVRSTARDLGLVAREAGLVTEVELPGPAGAPVLGLVVHGDVQPVDEKAWSVAPFEPRVVDGPHGPQVVGRGAADDKGPLVQALLAMAALGRSGAARTHTIRLLVGSDEESDNLDIKTWLQSHAPPDFSLVLDASFPVTVGEKAWQALVVGAPQEKGPRAQTALGYTAESLEAGLAPSIVPDRAVLKLRRTAPATAQGGPAEAAQTWKGLRERLAGRTPDEGTRLELSLEEGGEVLVATARGKSAHSGVNVAGGRNALVSLARLFEGLLPPGPLDDLLAFVRLAGRDLDGTGLGLVERDPLWGRTSASVTMAGKRLFAAAPGHEDDPSILVNLRRTPPLTGPQLQERVEAAVTAFNARTGAHLVAGGFYGDDPLGFDPQAKLVRRLHAAFVRASGRSDPDGISGGGTYAKRLPRSIAFGMWFPDKPYPGHDVDESNPVADLQLGARVLLEALVDLACGPPLEAPFER
jgi:acetylornithine deacetylase/succinyl-diaminopimelate desuccinylase-like protein